jgi:acylphosphatase
MARKRIFVNGRVQGVSYRAYAADEAMRLGLHGWVRNRKDGSVEALVDGDDRTIERFVEWCKTGSPASTVQSVDARDDVSTDALGPFEVHPTV